MPRAARPRSLEVQVRPIPVEAIDVAERNPRRSLPDVDDLAASLSAYGLLQPLVVRPRRDRFVLIAGHRRFAAAQRLAGKRCPPWSAGRRPTKRTLATLGKEVRALRQRLNGVRPSELTDGARRDLQALIADLTRLAR